MANPILLYTPIFPEVAEAFTEKVFEHPENEDINIWVNGPGGSLSAGWSMLAALNDRENINMTVTGDASSFYFFMLMFSDHNTAFDTSNFLIHRAASFWEEIMTDDELKDVENRNKLIRKKVEARIDETIFEEVTGKTFDDIFDMENRLDVRLTAQQAKKIGLVDKVIKLDVKKRAEIESRYFNDIAALAVPQKSNKSNSNKMGKLKDLIFGEKDPVLIAQIDETQFVYSKLEKGAKIKATGAGEHEPISGTFEAEDKNVTVVDNEITAVVEIDNSKKEFDTLKAEFNELKKNQVTVEEIAEVIDELQAKHKAEIDALKADLAKAKITVSKPKLPKGEFKDDGVADEELTLREKLAAYQDEMHEDKIKTREV